MKKVKNIFGVVVTILILIFLIQKSDFVFRANNTDQCIATINAFHNMPENSMDVIIYGSSHAWRGVDPVRMYDTYGIAAYNYAANWQSLSTEALFFFDSLRTQKPKVVLLETLHFDEVLMDQGMSGEVYYTRAINDFEYKREFLRTVFGKNLERYVAYYFPFSQFHSSWSNLNVDNFRVMYTEKDFEGTMGFQSYLNEDGTQIVAEVEIDNPSTFSQSELPKESLDILDKIVKTCKENDIEVIFFTTPFEGEYHYNDAIADYAEKNGCVYLDLFELYDEVGYDEKTDFCDPNHLNVTGAQRTADYLGKYIDEHYSLDDIREISGNMWEGKTYNDSMNTIREWNATHK